MILDKVQKVLQMQSEGIDISDIAKEFKYTGYKGLQNYMRSKGYSCIDRKFVPKGENSSGPVKKVKEDLVKETVKEVSKVSTAGFEKEFEKVMEELKDIKYYMMDEKYTHHLKMPVKNCGKGNPTSVRLYVDDKEDFDYLCKTKFKDINKEALFSLAIREFVEKYGDKF